MTAPSRDEITQLLRAWSEGEESAPQKLIPLVYEELHRRAHHYMAHERSDHTLQTSALVHEAYLQLVDSTRASWQDRAHFFAVSAQVMRSILVDWARAHYSQKRGGKVRPLPLDEALLADDRTSAELLALDDSLNALAALDPRKCQVVELRYWGGLSVEETAELLKISKETVARDWKFAKVWLRRQMTEGQEDEA
jgi:RNA polymerase sigma-70 factor, ECF subfamily